jgi:hypothetical protein
VTKYVGQLVGEASDRPAGGGTAPRGRGPAANLASGTVRARDAAGRSITIAGAKGGQGTSTVAAVLAIFAAGHRPTRLVSADAAPILGIPDAEDETTTAAVVPGLTLGPTGGTEPIAIRDGGTIPDGPRGGASYTVVRGPCYLALRAMLRADSAADGIILVVEDRRSLTQRDVEDVTGIPVVARVTDTARVARVIDAGLLIARLHHLTEFGDLRRLARRLFGPEPAEGRAA